MLTGTFFLVLFLGTLNSQLTICKYTASGQFLGGQAGCYNLVPVFDWIQRCIISIFLVFMISFLPLFLQGLLQNFLCLIRNDSPPIYRTCGTWYVESDLPFSQAVRVAIAGLRSFLNPDLHSLHSEQSDVWRRTIHCHRSWICND
jgi:1,3-beta-glucan synthase component